MDFSEYTSYLSKAIDSVDHSQIANFTEAIYDAFQRDAMIYVIGNGGSAANASHFAQDLAKGTCASADQVKRIRALSLTDNLAFISALGNDEGYDRIFEQQLRTFAKTGDMLIAISGSGNSPNILRAVQYASEHGIRTAGITGFSGGKLLQMVDLSVHVPLNDMCTSESVHSVIFHYVILELHKRMVAEAASTVAA